MTAVILFAHGSRDADWAKPLYAIRDRMRAAQPGVAIELAFLEMMQPTLADAVKRFAAAGEERICIAPLFMAQGAHLKRDLTALLDELRRAYPRTLLEVLPALGEMEPVLDAISRSITEAVA